MEVKATANNWSTEHSQGPFIEAKLPADLWSTELSGDADVICWPALQVQTWVRSYVVIHAFMEIGIVQVIRKGEVPIPLESWLSSHFKE